MLLRNFKEHEYTLKRKKQNACQDDELSSSAKDCGLVSGQEENKSGVHTAMMGRELVHEDQTDPLGDQSLSHCEFKNQLPTNIRVKGTVITKSISPRNTA